MKERVKRVIKICLLFVVLVIPFSYLSLVKADSGWDTGYSSGGGGGGWSSSGGGGWSSGGSSWSTGGSSRSRDGDYDYDGSGKGVILMFFIIFIVIVVVSILSENSGNNSNNIKAEYMAYPDIDESLIKQYLPDHTLGSLKNMAYKKFLAIQNAWMNFDYDALRELCTDELFNTYKSQLQVLKAKNGKNVMNGFFPKKINIYDVRASDGIISVKVYLKVSFFDYVVNTTSKKVTQGKRFKRITNHYEMVFVKSVMDNTVTRCPNCNASINFVTSGECPYCGSTIVVPPNQLVLSKKTNLLTK